jgi:hypothetical protein
MASGSPLLVAPWPRASSGAAARVIGYAPRVMKRLVIAEILVSLAVFALQEVPRGHGIVTLAYVVALAIALPFLLTLAQQEVPQAGHRTVTAALVGLTLAQLGFAVLRLMKPKVLDIGTITVAALQALAQGGNPYVLAIDPLAGGIAGAASSFHGYKYLPVMMAAYAPFALSFGLKGIILGNVALQVATATAIGAVAAWGGTALAGLAAAAIYLSLPFPAFQLLARGVNDLVAVLPLLCALLVVERRPFWTGLLVGLSIAAKLMPGLAALPCLVPERGQRVHYAAGVLIGLVPIVPFAAAAPDAFFDNIVLFNLVRPIDDTSWLWGMPGFVAWIARGCALLGLAAIAAQIWKHPPALPERCAAIVLAVLVVFAVGPDMHHNYYLWFIPFLAALAGRAAVPTPLSGSDLRREGAR